MATRLYLDIPGVGETISELRLGINIFQSQIYAQRNGLVVYGDRKISKVAEFTKPEDLKHHPQNPNEQWIRHHEKRGLTRKDIVMGYNQLRNDIWENYIVRSCALLLRVPSYLVEDQQTSTYPIYIEDWKIPDEQMDENFWELQDKTQRIVVNSFTPVPYWSKQSEIITPRMAQLLGAPDSTYILEIPNPNQSYHIVANALWWDFRGRVRHLLVSDWYPWVRYPLMGSLLGKKPEDKALTEDVGHS